MAILTRRTLVVIVAAVAYPDGNLAVFHGPSCLARYQATAR